MKVTPHTVTDKYITLDEVKFTMIGELYKTDDNKVTVNKLPHKRDLFQQSGVVYLFHNRNTNEIVYIGHTSLSAGWRLGRHYGELNRNSQVNDNYRILLDQLDECDFYIHVPEMIEYNGLTINPYESIETALIQKYKPIANTKSTKDENEGCAC